MARTVRLGIAGVCAGLWLVSAQPARADKVLVVQTQNNDPQGGDTAGPSAKAALEAAGHDVTALISLQPELPALADFDAVWFVQVVPISGTDRNALTAYVREGGGLYVTGERNCCEALNMSVQAITANLLRTKTHPTIGATPLEGGDLFEPNALDPFGITSSPNPLTEWVTKAAGLISANVPDERAIFKNAAGKVGAAAYPSEDVGKGHGCLYVAMDLTFWQPDVSTLEMLTPYAENIELFLKDCADSDHDGLSDGFELESGTDPDDPDSDDDTLCDGWGTVADVCIAGEHPLDDFEEDGKPSPLDDDDDDDGIPTWVEVGYETPNPNGDGDAIATWNDPDSDNDGFSDKIEGIGDYDGDGTPASVDPDDVPPFCDTDEDCQAIDPSYLCLVGNVSYCQPACRNGAGCADGQTCTSEDETLGLCLGKPGIPGGSGGAPSAAAGGPAESSAGESSTGGVGQDSGNAAAGEDASAGEATTGGAGAEERAARKQDAGCGCRTPSVPGSGGTTAMGLLLAAALLQRRRAAAVGVTPSRAARCAR